MADEKTRKTPAEDVCRIEFTPDGGIQVNCETPEATRKFVDAAMGGKVTVKFVPKVMPVPPRNENQESKS